MVFSAAVLFDQLSYPELPSSVDINMNNLCLDGTENYATLNVRLDFQ
jgi:hypothetical protein